MYANFLVSSTSGRIITSRIMISPSVGESVSKINFPHDLGPDYHWDGLGLLQGEIPDASTYVPIYICVKLSLRRVVNEGDYLLVG